MPSKSPPTVSRLGSKIVITDTGEPDEAIEVAIFRVVNNVDQTPPAFSVSSHLDGDGNWTVSSGALASGTYHVVTTTHPASGVAIFNNTITIP